MLSTRVVRSHEERTNIRIIDSTFICLNYNKEEFKAMAIHIAETS